MVKDYHPIQILQPVSNLVHSTGDIQIKYYGNIKENMDTTLQHIMGINIIIIS